MSPRGFFLIGIMIAIVAVTMVGGRVCAQEQPVTETVAPVQEADSSAPPVPAAATSDGVEKLAGGMQGFISLDLRDIDVIEALKFLARKADLDIVTTKNVAGRVTLMVEDVPVRDVFDIMLRSNKLSYVEQNGIYQVMTEEEYKALYGQPFADTRQVVTFKLQYAIPEQAFSMLDALKSDIGRVLVDPESGNALVIDIPSKIHDMQQTLDVFEEKNEFKVFALQYAKAKDVEEQLKSYLESKKVGTAKADDRANQVVVQTLPGRMIEVERLVQELDAKTKEVMIDASIIKVKVTDNNEKGFLWEGLFDMAKDKGLFYVGSTPYASVQSATDDFQTRNQVLSELNGDVGSYPFSGTTSDYSGSVPAVGLEKMHIGLVAAQDVDTVIKYVETLGSTRILANPKLVVTNNQESRIHVGEKQAYVTTTTTTGQVTSTVAENVTFVDVGIQLAVTPTINDDGFVTMKVKAEISSVTSTLVTPTQNEIPIIDTSLAETSVMVKEGTTVIIGGLRRDEESQVNRQTPWFHSIPVVGWLFKVEGKRTDRTELLILLTPKIITGEVFVARTGQAVARSSIKSRQDYEELSPADSSSLGVEALAAQDLETKKVGFKGLRVVE